MSQRTQDMVWAVTTHEHKNRSVDWYWALGVIALAGAVVSIFLDNLLLAIIIALGSGSIGFLAARGPREHLFKIDERGVSIDGSRYAYSSIHSFWVEHDSAAPRLFLTMRGVALSHFSLVLDSEAQGRAVREHLVNHIKEEEQGPHLGEHLAEIFGL